MAERTHAEPESRSSDARVLWPVAGVLLLVTPCAMFAAYHGYAPWRPELLLVLGALAGIGAAIGAVLARAGDALRVPVTALGVVLFLDFQTRWIDAWDARLAAAAAAALLVAALLRLHLARIVTAVFGTLLVTSWLLPAGTPSRRWSAPAAAARARAAVPPRLLHIVLDEQIGIEGIPRDFDPQRERAGRLRRFYTEHGFRVFGRAYSRYYDTHTSLANLLNQSAERSPAAHLQRPFREGDALERNRYFEELSRRGYRIHVVQPGYLDLCRARGEIALASCRTYAPESIAALADAPLSTIEKARTIAGVYLRLSFLLEALGRAVVPLREAWPATARWLPARDATATRISALATMQVLDGLADEILRAEDGSAFFVHLLLPHYPYAYDAQCALRPSPRDWLTASAAEALPRRNTPASRAARYPLYLDQVECTHARLEALFRRLEEAGVLGEMTLIVQGDHGSRIDRGPPHVAYLSGLEPADFVDGYSALFAIRRPGVAADYDRRVLPIELLLARAGLEDDLPDGDSWAPPPQVLLGADPHWTARVRTLVPHALPSFADGDVE